MNKFEQLLWDLGEAIHLPLHIDKNQACNILLEEHLKVQMQLDRNETHLLVCAFVADLAPGRFRENVLREALKANGEPQPHGVFAFYEKKNLLIFHQFFPIDTLNKEGLMQSLELLIQEAEEWYQAIRSGSTAPLKYQQEFRQKLSP